MAPARVDFGVFAPRPAGLPRRWDHRLGRLDSRGRLALPEVEAVLDEAGLLGAVVRADRWELSPAGHAGGGLRVDSRLRVLVPLGVRYQLGLADGVVVSRAVDGRRILLWSAARLDELLEGS